MATTKKGPAVKIYAYDTTKASHLFSAAKIRALIAEQNAAK